MSLLTSLDDDDDYVAKLLVEDARKSSLRYASQGMSALLPKRPAGSAPKPNTRFLKTLVREADSHNAKLKEKEELEARIRLQNIRDAERDARKDRRRERDDGEHYEWDRKRRRTSDAREDDREDPRDKRDGARVSGHSRNPERERERDEKKRRRRKQQHENGDSDEFHEYKRSRHNDSPRRRRSRSRSRSRSRERRPGETRKRHRQPDSERRPRQHSPPSGMELSGSKDIHRRARASSSSSTSSDPLAPLIGPHPISTDDQRPRRRGRGFNHRNHTSHQSRSNIDAHFSPTYDPSTHDAALDSDELNPEDQAGGPDDEWTSALSALRDRRAWRAKQAERMKDAGFTAEEITRWEKSASTSRGLLANDDDGDVRDVKWRKRGEEREWDIGKERSPETDPDPDPEPDPVINSRPARNHRRGDVQNGEGKKTRPDVDAAWRRPESALLKQFKSALR
ncbi:hypothetical protein AYO20_06406 [Fonsecaea nubica]|uniref:Uncharacterized protein n=1 Tax=Fonsecaea nubica TaxID=856822 RepID=A0A178CYZ8_9EURO|nr:hypothetical protein AYO20_06406 [Fonsecaea nubica]OAL34353.1 hypothetical protein AYO20_06406 [Fonsecaea nubica]